MSKTAVRAGASVESVREEFSALGLDPDEVLSRATGDPVAERRRLEWLLEWVYAYRQHPDRRDMEQRGHHFPPIDPGSDPDTDWLCFERWMQGSPVRWSFVRDFGPLKPPDSMMADELVNELGRVTRLLAERGVIVALNEAVPARLVYEYLRGRLALEEFEFLASGSNWYLDGCGGSCPDCFQRLWCDVGRDIDAEDWGVGMAGRVRTG